MTTNNEAFEKWMTQKGYALNKAGDREYTHNSTRLNFEVWQAAKADSAQEANKLLAEIAELKAEVKRWQENSVDLEYKHLQKNAHIYELREALEELAFQAEIGWIDNFVNEALAKTPAQSLTSFENEVIERCAKVCEGMIDRASTLGQQEEFREAQARIRALKKEME